MAKRYQFLDTTLQQLERAKFVECPVDGDKIAVRTKICLDDGESFPVYISTSGVPVIAYGEILALAGLATGDVVLYTVPVGKIFTLKRIDFSGENRGEFKMYIDASLSAKKRTYYTDYNGYMEFSDLEYGAGVQIKLEVTNQTNSVADFEGYIQGTIKDA